MSQNLKFTFIKHSLEYVFIEGTHHKYGYANWVGKSRQNDFLFWFSIICKTAENYFRLYKRRPRSAKHSDNTLPYYTFLFYVKLTLQTYHSHFYYSLSIWTGQQQHTTAKLPFWPPLPCTAFSWTCIHQQLNLGFWFLLEDT